MSKVELVCLCYLTSPTEAKHKYLERRVTALVQDAKVISVAWSKGGDHLGVQSPAHAISSLPKLHRELSDLSATVDGMAVTPLVI